MASQGLAMVDHAEGALPSERAASESRRASALAVERLTLTDFRCYAHQRLDVGPGPVVLTGPNGAGKTNLLEAISFLVPGRGLRHARLSDACRQDAETDAGTEPGPLRPWAVAARVNAATGPVEIGTGFEAGAHGGRDKRVVHVEGEPAKSQATLAEHLSVLWLTPQMDRLFQDGPASRRRFLDRLVFDSDPAHAGRLSAFEHAMRERARLLRQSGADKAWLATLEETMAAKGVAVAAARLDMVRRLTARLSEATGAFPGAALVADGVVETWLGDGPALAAEDRFREALVRDRGRDAEDGRTRTGPHRSDLKVRHLGNGRPAELCSTGEQKALLVALVLATARMRARERGRAPVLLLDEVAAHLDGKRLDALYGEILDLGAQAWLTGTDAALFRPLGDRAMSFRVGDGRVMATP